MNHLEPLTPKVLDPRTDLLRLIADTYGVALEEINMDSDLNDDIGWRNNPEELAFFLRRASILFDVHLSKDLILGEECQTVGDLVALIESEQLG